MAQSLSCFTLFLLFVRVFVGAACSPSSARAWDSTRCTTNTWYDSALCFTSLNMMLVMFDRLNASIIRFLSCRHSALFYDPPFGILRVSVSLLPLGIKFGCLRRLVLGALETSSHESCFQSSRSGKSPRKQFGKKCIHHSFRQCHIVEIIGQGTKMVKSEMDHTRCTSRWLYCKSRDSVCLTCDTPLAYTACCYHR